MDQIVSLISNLGFPIFVAVFLLIRIEPTLKKLQITLTEILTYLKKDSD